VLLQLQRSLEAQGHSGQAVHGRSHRRGRGVEPKQTRPPIQNMQARFNRTQVAADRSRVQTALKVVEPKQLERQ